MKTLIFCIVYFSPHAAIPAGGSNDGIETADSKGALIDSTHREPWDLPVETSKGENRSELKQ